MRAGLAAILAARGDRVQSMVFAPLFAATCRVTCSPRTGRNTMS